LRRVGALFEAAAARGEILANEVYPDGLRLAFHHVAAKVAGPSGDRLLVNDGAGRAVFHLHVLCGRPMRWPPG